MSLCDKGMGLLETHVEWKDIEKAFSSSFGFSCNTGTNRSFRHIGEGNGYLSRIALISPDWQSNNSDKLPQTFCVKICSQLAQVEYDEENARTETMAKLFRKMHNSEVDAYEIFEKYRMPGLKVAKLYAGHRFSEESPLKGFLILPYFERLVPVHIADNMSLSEVKQVIHAIAEMNCITFKITEEQKNKITKNMFSTICGTYFTETVVNNFSFRVRQFMEKDHPKLCDRLDEIKFKICSIEGFKELDMLCDKLGMVPLLTHGDLWSANLLWSKPGQEHYLEAIVDYQSLSLSTPAVDICSFICSALSGKERLEHTDGLIQTYFEILSSKVEGKMPFTLEQLKTSFTYIFPFHGFEILGTLVEIYTDFLENPKKWNFFVDEKQVLEKMHKLLEDIVDNYDKVQALRKAQ